MNTPITGRCLLELNETLYVLILTLGVFVLGLAFLMGKMYKVTRGVKRKKGWRILLIHIAVLTPIWLIVACYLNNSIRAFIFLIVYTAYVGFARLLVAQNLLFRIQLHDGITTTNY